MASLEAEISVQVCYAKPGTIVLKDLAVPAGSTVHDAIKRSGIVQQLPEIDLTVWHVGIYGKLKSLDTVLRQRDRVEIYRPLKADPKESRRKRAIRNGKATLA
jgi:putative ubiquitin-RnfH superfamily antitoxin RatB of RatAB toxin-antitoxin module